jgi:2-oxo-3-hexenedioate decarboxylase
MPATDNQELAREILSAYKKAEMIRVLPSSRGGEFDLAAAYAVQAELTRLREAEGHTSVGRKLAFVNRALWPGLGIETVAWASVYADTLHYAATGSAAFSLARCHAPKIEPEVVFKLKHPIERGGLDAAAVLNLVDWLALGFEIVDCPFPSWQFKPPDFVAAFGFHTALFVGPPLPVELPDASMLAEALPRLKLRLWKNDELVEEGSGANVLGSPALSLAEAAGAMLRQSAAKPLAAGEVVTTGSFTTPQPIHKGESWRAEVEGLALPGLALRFD